MKILSRDFNVTEKLLILLLCLILIALAYYWFVDQPVRNGVLRANAERDALQIELTAVQAKVGQLQKMQSELDRLGSLETVSRMESYNNSKAELSELNRILESAEDYSISFASLTRDGDQIRRNFTLQFTTGTYDSAKQIMSELAHSRLRCMLGDVRYSDGLRSSTVSRNIYGEPAGGEDDYLITVNTTATFFETMYDGTPDSGLPADSRAAQR